MCRLFYMCCVLSLLQGLESAYAQEEVSVPVTIILEGPENKTSASQTAPPELIINTPEIDLQLGSFNRFRVSLRSRPIGQVNVSIEVIDEPPGGDARDVTITTARDDGTLLFLPDEWNRRKIVRVDAETDAELGDYTVKLDASGSEGTDTKNVSVTVEDWMTFHPILPLGVYRGRYNTLGFYVRTDDGGAPRTDVTLTLEILEPVPEYLSVSPEPPELIFTESNHSESQEFRVNATDQAVVGARHPFRVNLFRDGYNDISRGNDIVIVAPPCTLGITETRDLGYGAWSKSGDGDERWSVAVDYFDGSIDEMTNVTQVSGNSVSVGKAKLSTINCGGYRCGLQIVKPDILTGSDEGGIINFDLDWDYVGGGNKRNVSSSIENRIVSIADPDKRDLIFQFGGTISGLLSETPRDTYTSTITVRSFCFRP